MLLTPIHLLVRFPRTVQIASRSCIDAKISNSFRVCSVANGNFGAAFDPVRMSSGFRRGVAFTADGVGGEIR